MIPNPNGDLTWSQIGAIVCGAISLIVFVVYYIMEGS